MSLGIFKKAFNSTQISDLTAYFSTLFPQKKYREFTALITQSSINTPSLIILEDDFNGGITVSRDSAGVYLLTSSVGNIFNENKTYFSIFNNNSYLVTSPYTKSILKMSVSSVTIIRIETFLINEYFLPSPSPFNGTYSDSIMYKTPLTIRVYN
jgi:hypothetical protein